jgi:hypothetical protein
MFADGYSRDFRAASNLPHDRTGDVPSRTSGDQLCALRGPRHVVTPVE